MDNFFIILLFILIILLAYLVNFVKLIKANFVKLIKANKNIKINKQYGGTNKIKINKTKNKITKKYSLCGNSGINYDILKQMLKERNYIEVSTTEPYVDLAWGDFVSGNYIKYRTFYDLNFIKQKSYLKNLLSNRKLIGNKDLMYLNIKKYIPDGLKFLPKTDILSNFLNNKNNKKLNFPLIIKDNIGSNQVGIKIVLNMNEIFKAVKDLKIEHKKHKTIICEYISNPLLIYGLKFNLRPYFLLYSDGKNKNKCFCHSEYTIWTTNKLYTNDNYSDNEVHLSGGDNIEKIYFWPKDFEPLYDKSFLDQCQLALDNCNNFICKFIESVDIHTYPESETGFQLYCADLLITEDAKVYLLEINTRCGMSLNCTKHKKSEYLDNFSIKYFKWILDSLKI